jgi:hypothetical protein
MGVDVIFTAKVTCDICGREIKSHSHIYSITLGKRSASDRIATVELAIGLDWKNDDFEVYGYKIYCGECRELYENRRDQLKADYNRDIESISNWVKSQVNNKK